ncbi:MAG: methanogenesis marker 17 protein [Methanobacterium sp.]|jgi:putative methanogenesis marker protein 17|nr:methanogenesis marker 17 protein [Methanobacterium sp.]
MQVECYDENGREVYDMILRQILQDIQIVRAVNDVRIYIDPREPVFIIALQYMKTAPPVVLEDFAEYEYDAEANETFIRIKDENYLPELLKKLWEVEGRNKIHQPSRYEVIIDDPQVKLEGLVVHDPEEDLKKKIYDALFRIIPEGFRVIEHYSEGNIIALTCSDELIKEEYLEKTQEIIAEMKNNKTRNMN